MERLRSFEMRTGIKVNIMGSPDDPVSVSDAESQSDVMEAQDEFNLSHLDEGRIDSLANDYIDNFKDRLRDFIGNDPGLKDVASDLNLGGNALSDCINRFYKQVLSDKKDAARANEEPQVLVKQAFNEAVRPILAKKAEIIRHVNTLQFETKEQGHPLLSGCAIPRL